MFRITVIAALLIAWLQPAEAHERRRHRGHLHWQPVPQYYIVPQYQTYEYWQWVPESTIVWCDPGQGQLVLNQYGQYECRRYF